jgi:hypothetical protein
MSLRIAGRLSGAREVAVTLVQPTWPGTGHVTERFAEFHEKRLGLGEVPLAFCELLASYRTWLAFLLACREERNAGGGRLAWACEGCRGVLF